MAPGALAAGDDNKCLDKKWSIAGYSGGSNAPLESLAECADPSWPHSEWHLYLLGFAGLSARAGSTDWQLRLFRGHRYLGVRTCARTTSLQQSAGLDLQPHEPRAV